MKKYYFKGTNQEVKLGDKITTIITCSNGRQYKNNGTVDIPTIKDLLRRNSIEFREEVPVQKKIVKGKSGKSRKLNENIIVIDNSDLDELDGIVSFLLGFNGRNQQKN